MGQSKLARRLRRPLCDFATGLIVFWVLAAPCVLGCDGGLFGFWPSSARAHFQARPLEAGLELALQAPSLASFVSLALAFASVFALNLWLVRHIRRVHATYRHRR